MDGQIFISNQLKSNGRKSRCVVKSIKSDTTAKQGLVRDNTKSTLSIIDTMVNKLLICEFCDGVYKRVKELIEHKKNIHGIPINSVEYHHIKLNATDKMFNNSYYINTNNNNHQAKAKLERKSSMACRAKMACEKCGKLFHSQKFLSRHMNQVHNKISITTSCDVCQKVFSDKKCMKKHHDRLHNFGAEFICNECQAVFNYKPNLRKHIKIHHLPPTLECSICSKMLPTDQSLRYHLRLAHASNHFLCPDCGKCFRNKGGLKMHEIIHTGKKPYVCKRCGKCFRTDSNLYQHARTHSDTRPFKCSVCDKGFRIKHHLRQHMAKHGMASVPKYGKREEKHLSPNMASGGKNI